MWKFPQLIRRYVDVWKCFYAQLELKDIPDLNEETLNISKPTFILCEYLSAFSGQVTISVEYGLSVLICPLRSQKDPGAVWRYSTLFSMGTRLQSRREHHNKSTRQRCAGCPGPALRPRANRKAATHLRYSDNGVQACSAAARSGSHSTRSAVSLDPLRQFFRTFFLSRRKNFADRCTSLRHVLAGNSPKVWGQAVLL